MTRLRDTPISLWLLAWAIPLTYVITSWWYFDSLLRSGTLDPDADTIGIPIIGNFIVAALAVPIILIVTRWAVWRYPSGASIFSTWDAARPIKSFVANVLCLVVLALIAFVLFDLVRLDLPWYEYLWVPFGIIVACWALAIRAAAVAPMLED